MYCYSISLCYQLQIVSSSRVSFDILLRNFSAKLIEICYTILFQFMIIYSCNKSPITINFGFPWFTCLPLKTTCKVVPPTSLLQGAYCSTHFVSSCFGICQSLQAPHRHRKKRWQLPILPQCLVNLTQPIRHKGTQISTLHCTFPCT